jgi:hypothetical protein
MSAYYSPPKRKTDDINVGDRVRMILIGSQGNSDFKDNIAIITKIHRPGSYEIEVVNGRKVGTITSWTIDLNNWDFEFVNCEWDR